MVLNGFLPAVRIRPHGILFRRNRRTSTTIDGIKSGNKCSPARSAHPGYPGSRNPDPTSVFAEDLYINPHRKPPVLCLLENFGYKTGGFSPNPAERKRWISVIVALDDVQGYTLPQFLHDTLFVDVPGVEDNVVF